MQQKWTAIGDYTVEIWFRIEKDKQGYPRTRVWEQLLAQPIVERVDYFQIESIPFYLKDVSRGDVVRTKITENGEIQDGEVFEFDGIVQRGGHNTYRLLLKQKHPDDPAFTENELLSKGLLIEVKHEDFFAVDVPPSLDQQAIDRYLVTESESGRWGLQDGYLSTIKTHSQG